MAGISEIIDQISSTFGDMTGVQKILVGIIVATVAVSLFYMTMGETTTNYQVLFTSLNQDDAGDVVVKLKEQRIPYELAMNGTVIKVPADKVLDTRLSLAADGLPRGGGVGFEIFDRTSLGTTDFVQKLNYQRALQGELARTIRQFQQVKEARVHIATPKESVFIEDQRPPSASVSLQLRGGNKLAKKQVQAIVNLVGSAVAGLTEENITVVDTSGRLLFRKQGDSEMMLSASQLEYQLRLERTYRDKIESMLEEIVGIGKAVARVSAELDFSQVNSTQELYDPEGQVVRSEQLLNDENLRGALKPEGIPGVKGNLATFSEEDSNSASGGDSSQRNNITRNYEVSKTIKHVREAVGALRKVSVAVMVDGVYEKSVDKEGDTTLKYIARSEDELKRFERMAKNAVGFDTERGDQLEVVGMSFATSLIPEPKVDPMDKWQGIIETVSKPVIYLVMAICFVFFVIRPLSRLLSKKQIMEQRRAMQEKLDAERSKIEEEDLKLRPKAMSGKEKIMRLAQSDPDRAADLVRKWLREEG